MDTQEKERRLKKAESAARIYARDAEIGKTYLTVGMLYKVKIEKKNGVDFGCTSVLVKSETAQSPLSIAGGTELIAYEDDLYIPPVNIPVENATNNTKDKTTPKGETPMKEPKEKGAPHSKMSDVITPMLLEGKSPEEIADKVIAAAPDKSGDRANLIRQIKGPRRYNLVKKLEKEGKEVPAHLKDKPAKGKKE